MWKPLIVLAVSAFALTGCAGTPEGPADTSPERAEAAAGATNSTEETGPLVAKKSEDPNAGSDPEGAFLESMRGAQGVLELEEASDAQYLEAGYKACEQMAGGATTLQVQVVEGEEMVGGVLYETSRAIATYANQFLCPEVSTR